MAAAGFLWVLVLCWVPHCTGLEVDAKIGPGKEKSSTSKVLVNTSNILNTINDDAFLCVCQDWWPADKCDYGRCSWGQSGLQNLDLENPILTRALEALTPVTVRAGGTLANLLVYDIGEQIPSETCRPFLYNESAVYNFTGGCLSMQRWDALNAFWKRAGVTSVVFGISNLYGRSKERADHYVTDPWITNNIYDFMKYSIERFYPVTGWEVGNELLAFAIGKEILPEDYAQDVKKFNEIVDELYPPPLKKPLVIAPDLIYLLGDTKLNQFLGDSGSNVIDVVTRHSYNLGPGLTAPANLIGNILSRKVADEETALYESLNEVLLSHSTCHPNASVWVGEGGGAFGSGGDGVTNAYVMAFWYIDQLGKASKLNNHAFCRQTLVGGYYGLLDTDSFVPNRDYYGLKINLSSMFKKRVFTDRWCIVEAALLWRKLMGKVVFDVAVKGTDDLRAYAHCQRKSPTGVTFLVLNYSNSTNYSLDVEFLHGNELNGVRHEYHMSAPNGNLTSKVVLLNGWPLGLTPSGNIPEILPFHVESSKPVSIEPLTYAFVVFRNVKVLACALSYTKVPRQVPPLA